MLATHTEPNPLRLYSGFAVFLLSANLSACGQQEAPRAPAAAAQVAVQRADSDDLAAYERGVRREIGLTEAALRLLECAPSTEQRSAVAILSSSGQILSAGARAAGLDSVPYGLLVARVDSELRVRGGRGLFAGDAGRLDSLRVRLVVLRTRHASEAAQSFDGRVQPAVRPSC